VTVQPAWSGPVVPTCAAIAQLLSPNAEVVLHDIETDTIVGLWNGFSNRRPGDPSLLSDILPDFENGQLVVGPYEKVNTDGRRLTSISAAVCDADGKTRGLLCVNLDQSPLDGVLAVLTKLAKPDVSSPPAALFDRDWREQIASIVESWCQKRHLTRSSLSRAQRLELVAELEHADLFATRHSADHAARALGVSRATVYSLLREIRAGRGRT
jgi:predicted transcriptional regulator YheO